MHLVPNEEPASVLARETTDYAIAVLPGALQEIGRHADIQRPVALARHDIDVSRLHTAKHDRASAKAPARVWAPAFAGVPRKSWRGRLTGAEIPKPEGNPRPHGRPVRICHEGHDQALPRRPEAGAQPHQPAILSRRQDRH